MAMKYCSVCEKNVDAKRKIGIGTLIAVLFTAFFWILLIPFYSKRCPICQNSHLGRAKKAAELKKIINASVAVDPIAQLETLARLKASGAISEREYNTQKKKLLR
ncbi:SHOCT domain-containing protein [Xenorhabdus sp. Flor]|uniref:SHOCT domain-containing protein n=1 Tax=Xenorhabdus cabanillasii TaxID=351673 RepID=UPI00199010EC|nr:SHOCT domain-containing protein [Xenorhabdus sp. Flor]MBD2816352.1 SHOCT domain-containing protein [Xenorhabdus sp. Flor]